MTSGGAHLDCRATVIVDLVRFQIAFSADLASTRLQLGPSMYPCKCSRQRRRAMFALHARRQGSLQNGWQCGYEASNPILAIFAWRLHVESIRQSRWARDLA